MREVYVLSGLGADERVFQNIDFSGLNVHFLRWIHNQPNETIEAYAARMREQIQSERPILIGLSFGGIVSIEIAKQIPVEKVILLASVKTQKELPLYFRICGALGLYRFIPAKSLTWFNGLAEWYFGLKEESNKTLLKQILAETGIEYYRWAAGCIFRWHNKVVPENLVHIHGSADRVFGIRRVHCDHLVRDGGHFMTMERGEEIGALLKKEINPGC